ncbi:PREDICTED: long-chain fatty acid transport protein 3 [Lepidothrix coronata]|uniref:long-chain-fatty-acid--CoA ligase n=1 Tax=Lepidothrix coronata TaxID=321398 RepID=A0A6J0J797_9PASS|nr:PREDICTED: long-chain fatty acid transport protein 3 [Lepidothrix coronata]
MSGGLSRGRVTTVGVIEEGVTKVGTAKRRLRPHLWADLAFAVRAARCRRRAGGGPGGGPGGSVAARFLRLARAAPARPFLRGRGGSQPLGGAARAVARVANALRALRAPPGPGDTVGLLVGNEPRFVWGWFGLAALGARPAFLGTALRPAGLRHCLRGCGARAVLVSDELFGSVEPLLPTLREDGVAVWVLGRGPYPPGVVALQELLDTASDQLEPEDVWEPRDMNETCLYIFTSGTTGLPKAARVSHLKSIMCLGFYELVGASSGDVVYLALPLYHMAGALLGVVGCLGIGATCVLREKFSASQFWDDCRAEGVTVFQYIGELCRYLVNQPQRPGERQHGLRLAVGSGLRPDVWRSFQQRFGPIRIVETYGMSEGNVTLFNYTGTPGAVGRGSFIYKLFSPFEIVRFDVAAGAPERDRAGRCIRAGPGETGLLIAPVTPRTPFLGYAGPPELSEQKLLRGVFAEGDAFFNTGDLVEQDRDQFVRFRDRIGDTFRWKGENVATTEVAEALLAHESLQEATVYGVTVPGHEGRAGMAALVLQPGHSMDGPGLFRHLEQLLPPYARPRFLRVQERLEMTETFKQQKVRLAQEGADPGIVPDPLFLLDEASQSYIPLDPKLWERLRAGHLRI